MNEKGEWTLKSTKQTDRKKALAVAQQYEKAAKLARAGELSANHYHKFLNELLEITGGEGVHRPSTEGFLKEWVKSKELSKSAGTAERYANTVRLFLRSAGEAVKRPITSIASHHIQNFLDARLAEGVAPKTAIVDIKTLRSAFNRARKQGLVTINPAEAVDLPENESSKRETFTPAQIQMLVDAAPDTEWKTLILLGAFTGARQSDCARMTWGNVDLVKGCLRFSPVKTKGQKKGGNEIVIPLHPDLEAHLLKLAEKDSPEEFLCPSLSSKGSGGKHGLSSGFKNIMGEAGIDCKTIEGKGKAVEGKGKRKFSQLSFHSLRHTFNSALADAGVSQEIRMKLAGHSTFAINAKYTHHELEPLKAAVAKLPSVTIPQL